MTVASTVFPLRKTYIQTPIRMAMGMVLAMVKVPHELSARAFTTTNPSPAMAMMMMTKVAMVAVTTLPVLRICERTISTSDLPSLRTEAVRMTMSCTAPAITAPTSIHRKPGKKPNWQASTGPTSGPAPAMAAKW